MTTEQYNAAVAALKPFAKFHERLTDGRRGYPTKGELWTLDAGCETEASITVEHLAEAARIVQEQMLELKNAPCLHTGPVLRYEQFYNVHKCEKCGKEFIVAD